MNLYVVITFFMYNFLYCTVLYGTNNSTITIKHKWRNLEKKNSKSTIDFGGKWMLADSITFKKKSKDPISLETIQLKWHGPTLSNLVASLYKKNSSKDFLPIEENLICDGIWNNSKQTIIFNFDEKETLAPITTFYLVLTIPDSIEKIITEGHFSLDEQGLPKLFKNTDLTNVSLATTETAASNKQKITS